MSDSTADSSPDIPAAELGPVRFGLGTFGDVSSDDDGSPVPHAQVIRDVVEQAVLADQVGVDAIAIGEHHRDDFAVTAPEVVLAAIAARTERITLASGVTVLSSDEPVRVFERFATVDALSNGRAEVQLGRGSFTESFPLFGFPLTDYEVLFEEKLDLFAHLLEEGPVTWNGTVRAPLTDQEVFPKTEGGRIPTWIGVGGSPESVIRAARYNLPLMLAIIGGEPLRFKPYADLYRRAQTQLEVPALPIGVHSPGFIAETDEQAREIFWPHYRVMNARIGAERGWPPITREHFEGEIESGSLYVGSPETVATKIAATVQGLGIQRFDLKYTSGPIPHRHLLEAVRLYGQEVVPRVRAILGEAPAGS
ncbi:LLM class flavin-dependent oxidoreductase [Schumannella soli]|uniref:LLM class flavin-dependent oxidoreductase n=1 Tax=Schumannella soli TaxID=2590779 RepID=A0A506XZ07_9MICO|nr:LLM class flavin-dependent oxidoreductase [Schumannella soli]TPW74507.1 LLM class flavin-dependent oxidoreductase [Schumannella soli]